MRAADVGVKALRSLRSLRSLRAMALALGCWLSVSFASWTVVSVCRRCGLNHRCPRTSDPVATYKYIRASFIREYRYHTKNIDVAPQATADTNSQSDHTSPYSKWGYAVLNELRINAEKLLKERNLPALDEEPDVNIDDPDATHLDTAPTEPTFNDALQSTSMKACIDVIFKKFKVVLSRIDKAPKNMNASCPIARAMTTLEFLLPDNRHLANYINLPDEDAINGQLEHDRRHAQQLQTQLTQLTARNPHDEDTTRRIKYLTKSISTTAIVIDYISSRGFSSYEITDMDPAEAQDFLEAGMLHHFPRVKEFFPRPVQTDREGKATNVFPPGPFVLSDKKHKTDKQGKPITKYRIISVQVNTPTSPLDRFHETVQAAAIGPALKARSLRIYEDTSINPYHIISKSKDAAATVPAQTNNLNNHDIVNCYGALTTHGEYGLIKQLSRVTDLAVAHQHSTKEMPATAPCGFILGGKRTFKATKTGCEPAIRPYAAFTKLGRHGPDMTTPNRRPRDDDDTIPPALFTANKLKQLIAWSLASAHNRFGQLVWRQRSGLPAGVPAGVNYANHYFHSTPRIQQSLRHIEIIEESYRRRRNSQTYRRHQRDPGDLRPTQ